ncbi:hydroxyacid dehydrogenase [Opitutaceae bacterium TAV4]|nr:hydroxyacid dehydrogenase [Opitutaceae bacterium TAV4]RRJ99311.1 hydroxyacid dehydrogenase [Opitutaceae bacterium TAV3]
MIAPAPFATEPASRTRATKPRALRLLVLLTDEERFTFFPDGGIASCLEFPNTIACCIPPADPVAHDWTALLEQHRPDVLIGAWSLPPLPAHFSGWAPRYYCHLSGAIRRHVPLSLIEDGLLVTNWGDSTAPYVAEVALMHTLAALQNAGHHQFAIHQRGGWRCAETVSDKSRPRSLFGLRVGLHGFGAIAREYVHLLAPFHPRLSAWDPYVSAATLAQHDITPTPSLEALFQTSDVLAEFAALTPETDGIVNKTLLSRLPADAVFINVARGRLVDEAALADCVSSEKIRAGLDVFAKEPLPLDSPLRGQPAVHVTPHIGLRSAASRLAAGRHAVQNLARFARGLPLLNPITPAHYARMT